MAGFGGSVKLKGETEYKKALKDITTNLTVLASEMKVVNSVYDKNDSSTNALKSRNEVLNKTLDEQTKKLNEAKKMLDQAKTSTDSNATTVAKWQNEVNKAQAQVNKTTNELNKNNEAIKKNATTLKENQSAYSTLNSKIDEQGNKLQELKKQYANTVLEQGKNSKTAKSLAAEIKNLSSDLADNKDKLERAESSADKLDESLSEVRKSSKDTSNGFTVMKGALANLVSDGFRKAIDGAKEFAKSMINVSAEVKAENSQFEQTFGDMQSSATEAIERVAGSTGILETRLKTVGSQIYAFARSSGATVPEAMELMESALQASADSAAYYDKSLEESSETLQSFLKGNYANDAALGVSATEFTRNAKATELFGKKYNDLTEIQKQQTLLKMVTDSQKVSGAMGQASREADGWENVQGNLNETWRQFKAMVGTPFLEALIPVLQDVTKSFQEWSNNVDWEAFENKVKEITEAIKNGFGWIIENSSSIITGITGIASALAVIKIGEIVVKVIAFINTIKKASTIFAGFKIALAGIGGPVTLIIAGIVGIATALVTLWNTNENFRNAVIGAWNKIKEVAGTVWGGITDFFTKTIPEAWQNVVTTFSGAGEWFSSIWQGVLDTFVAFGESIATFFTETIPNVFNEAITFITDTLTKWGNNIATFFIETIPQLWRSLLDWFNSLPEKIGYALGYTFGTIVKWGTDVWNYLVTNVPIWINNVVTFFSELPGKISTWLVDTFNKIAQFGVDIFNKSVDIGSNFLNNIINFFSEMPGKVWNLLTKVWNNIVSWGTDVKNKAVETGSNFINNIITFFSQLPGKIWAWLSNALEKVSYFASDLWGRARDAGQNLVSGIIDTITSLPDKVAEVGRNIVEGLWNGINSMGNWVWNKISGFCDGVVDGVKSALGIHSPSRVFRDEVGKQMAMGLGIGFENTMKDVNKEMANAIQTDYDLNVNSNLSNLSGANASSLSNIYASMVNAFKEALSQMNNQTIVNMYSPKALSVSEGAREFEKIQRKMVLGIG